MFRIGGATGAPAGSAAASSTGPTRPRRTSGTLLAVPACTRTQFQSGYYQSDEDPATHAAGQHPEEASCSAVEGTVCCSGTPDLAPVSPYGC